MNILLISEYILLGALAIFAVATIRITTRKKIAMALVGLSGLSIAVATMLVLVQNIYGLGLLQGHSNCTGISRASWNHSICKSFKRMIT